MSDLSLAKEYIQITVSISTGTPHLLALIRGSIPLAIRRYSLANSSSFDFFASSAACLNILCRSCNTANCLSCRVAKGVFVGKIFGGCAGIRVLVEDCRDEGFSKVIMVDSDGGVSLDCAGVITGPTSISSAFRGAPGMGGYPEEKLSSLLVHN
jgi:hypothetical protein